MLDPWPDIRTARCISNSLPSGDANSVRQKARDGLSNHYKCVSNICTMTHRRTFYRVVAAIRHGPPPCPAEYSTGSGCGMRCLIATAAVLLAALSVPGPAYADLEPVDPLPGAATTLQAPAAEPVAPWQTLAARAPFHPDTALLLTDGTVMAQDDATADWWRLAPDEFGKYIDGTWTQLPPMPDDYAPYDYCSAVLADGRVIVEGGEYTYIDGVATATETNQGAIYDPVANSWQVLDPPPGWTKIGDSSCLVLPNGKFLLARSFNSTPLGQVAVLDPATLSWTVLARPRAAGATARRHGLRSRRHRRERQVQPADNPVRHRNVDGGTVLPTVAGGQLDVCDGPAVLLTNGSVLVGASPGCYNIDDHFFEFDGTDLREVTQPPFGPGISSFWARLLMLPTGEVLVTFDNRTAWIYTSTGRPDPSWAPSITTCPVPDDPTRPGEEGTPGSVIAPGATYTIAGRQLNGVSQAENYGDD